MKINRLHRNFISMLLPVVWCVPLLAQDAGPLAATPPATSELEPAETPASHSPSGCACGGSDNRSRDESTGSNRGAHRDAHSARAA